MALFSWERHMCNAKVSAASPWVLGGLWDKWGHVMRQGESRTARETAEHTPSQQGPCSHARRLEGPQSLNSTWTTSKSHLSTTQKGSKLAKPVKRLPLTSVSCRSSPQRLIRITYFELASWNKSTAVSVVAAPDLNGDRLIWPHKYCSSSSAWVIDCKDSDQGFPNEQAVHYPILN